MSTLSTLPSLPSIDSEAAAFENPDMSDYVDTDSVLNNPQLNYQSEVYPFTGTINTAASTAPTIPSIPTTGYDTPASAAASTNAAASNVVTATTGVLTSIWNIVTGNIENGIFVVLGLLLIAAGIFAFKSTQTVVKLAGKAGTVAAEAAA